MRGAPDGHRPFETFERMFREKRALRLLLAGMREGATEEEALRLHRKIRQIGRRPCSFLDRELGIQRR